MAEPTAPVERACDRCRERRVKCDKRHPACFRCEKLGKPCPGYDKKRKFVDEGVTLRKKYETEVDRQSNSGDLAELSLNSPTSTLGGASYDSPSSFSGRKRNFAPHQASRSKESTRPRMTPTSNGDLRQSYHPEPDYFPTTALNQIPPFPADMDIDSMLNDVIDTSQFDPDWFNLEPASFYGKNNNSCGFIPNLPNIVDEVDKGSVRPTTENHDAAMSGISDANLWASESQFHTSNIITDEREHEMAFLVRHFTESIGPWMDLFDCEKHFGQHVPLKALRDALLKNAVAAVAAKQLGRVRGIKPLLGGQMQRPAAMETIDEGLGIDWFYKAANYYDKAIMYSRVYLQALSGSLSNPPSPELSACTTAANSDDLLLAVSIFSLYESLDNVEAGWLQHLTGMKSLLSVMRPTQADSQQPLDITIGRRASFWNFARADYQAAYINHTPTLLDTEDLPMWQSCGLQISDSGELYDDPEKIQDDAGHRCATIETVSHTLLWIILRTMNYLALPQQSPVSRKAVWDQLSVQLKSWFSSLPAAFQPCAQLRHPASRRQIKHNSPGTIAQFSEVFFSIPLCAATIQLYHFAKILLLQNPPDSLPSINGAFPHTNITLEASTEALEHAYDIVGIALARPHPAVRVEMLLPLYVAGTCMAGNDERRVVLEILRAIELDTGCTTQGRVRALMKQWGWDSTQLL